jgi:hypothetical protein
MPTYQVTDPTTGKKLRLTGDSPPTEQELEQIFSSVAPQTAISQPVEQGKPRFGGIPVDSEKLSREMTHEAKPMTTTAAERNLPELGQSGLLSGEDKLKIAAIAPVLVTTTNPQEISQIIRSNFPNVGQQQDEKGNELLVNQKTGARAIINKPGISQLDILQALGIGAAYLPSSGASGLAASVPGKIAASGLAAGATETAIQGAQKAAGGEFNPEQVAASTAFGAGGEAIGLGARAARETRKVNRLTRQAAPSVQDLRQQANQVYQQIDNSGAMVSGQSMNRLRTELLNAAARRGFRQGMAEEAAARLYPKSSALRNIIDRMEGAQTITDLEQLRRAAQDAAQTLDRADAGIARQFVSVIDDFVENLTPQNLTRGQNVAPLLRNARDLWSRSRKSELIQNALRVAEDQASGFENGIRVQLRSILKRIDTGKLKGFTQDEIDALRQVTRGTTPANFFKFLGKFGISEKQATSMLGASMGIGGGAAVGGALGGPGGSAAGAILVPGIGQVSKKLAQFLTRRNAQFADSVIRAGNNSRQVITSYLRNVPSNQRSVQDLGQLLLRTNVNAPQLARYAQGNQLIRNAILYAGLMQAKQAENIQPPQEIQTEVRP